MAGSGLPWLTREFLQDVLETSENVGRLEVTGLSLERLVGDEDGPFGRRRHRVAVDFHVAGGQPRSMSLQVSTTSSDKLARELEDVGHLLEREALVYRMLLPDMYDILNESRLPPLTLREFPSYRKYATLTEDAWGWRRGGRWSLDLPTCVLVVRSLARFHAASAALLERTPHLEQQLRERVYAPENEVLVQRLHVPGLEALARAVDGWPDYRHFASRLREFAQRAPGLLARACTPADVRVLSHGRLEGCNLAFPRDGEVRLLDLRWCRVATPALDLHHLLATGAEDAVRAQYSAHLLQEYLDVFRSTAREVGCRTKLSEAQLDGQMNDTAFYALIAATTDLQLRHYEDGPSGTLFRKSMQKMLLRLESNGVL